ncbi:MAG: hypothetical protein KJN63_11580 [Acidimicrobiia bacterium]|nr:hypothetical protein [Acidimicrobiia bacterium]
MSTVHQYLAWILAATTGITGTWATAAHWRNEFRTGLLVPAIFGTWVLTVVQVTVGVIVLQSGLQADDLHYFYGFLAMASVAIIYSYRQQIPQWEYLLLGGGNLFIMGLALRAVFL